MGLGSSLDHRGSRGVGCPPSDCSFIRMLGCLIGKGRHAKLLLAEGNLRLKCYLLNCTVSHKYCVKANLHTASRARTLSCCSWNMTLKSPLTVQFGSRLNADAVQRKLVDTDFQKCLKGVDLLYFSNVFQLLSPVRLTLFRDYYGLGEWLVTLSEVSPIYS